MSVQAPPRPFLGWALAVLVLDQASKLVVYRTMTLNGEPRPILGSILRLTYIQNPGAAFSLFHGSRWFFVGVSLLSMLVLLSLALSGRYPGRLLMTAFGLIFGGALGNLIDRLWLGVVIDFIQMGIGGRYWPVYNVADIGVTLGVALLAWQMLFDRKEADGPSGAEPG